MSEDQKPEAEAPKPQGGSKSEKFDFNMMIYELWNGKLPLFQVFWLYYFAVIFVLAAAANFVGMLATMIHLVKLIWAGFMVKPIWIAADGYKGPKHWALLAKVAAVLIALAVAGQLLSGKF